MDIEQKIIFHNKSKKAINHLIIYDWNNSYSESNIDIGKSDSDNSNGNEFDAS